MLEFALIEFVVSVWVNGELQIILPVVCDKEAIITKV